MKNNIDLGTLIDFEMYNNTNSIKGTDMKRYSKTLQQPIAVDNDSAPTALTSAPQAFQAATEEEEERNNVCGSLGVNGNGTQTQVMSNTPGFVRLNPHATYDRISIQLANYRDNGRYRRANVYVALKESTEQKFNVWLTGAATNCKTELYRGCKNSQAVKDVIDALFDKYPDIMIARLRYKSINGYITDFHKKNTKSAIIGIHKDSENNFISTLVLYYEMIEIPLTNPTSYRQKDFYIAHGIYDANDEFDDEEEV